ncbi:MAG: hypothetical protein IIC89_03700 [Chloroflexi bacterium]|nr:hypothetical protein [Chloroflexota bacterium]
MDSAHRETVGPHLKGALLRWLGPILIVLAGLAIGCSGGTSDQDAPGESASPDPTPIISDDDFQSALLRDLPLLEEEEASCISDAILKLLPDLDAPLEDVDVLAVEILVGAQAAQEKCLTPERIAELEESVAVVRPLEPEEEAYVLVVRGVAGGLDTEDQELLEAGYLVCALAEAATSLETLLVQFAQTPLASANAAQELSPLLGKVLQLEELITFSTVAVVALCPGGTDR